MGCVGLAIAQPAPGCNYLTMTKYYLIARVPNVPPINTTLGITLHNMLPIRACIAMQGPVSLSHVSLSVLGGLWPLADGRIFKPGGGSGDGGLAHEIFYVPQRPYVTVGSLREQIMYPLTLDTCNAKVRTW